MKNTYNSNKLLVIAVLLIVALFTNDVNAQQWNNGKAEAPANPIFLVNSGTEKSAVTEYPLIQDFESVEGLPGFGWAVQNNSNPAGNSWFQGNPTVFPAHQGEGYIGVNFNALGSGSGTISSWLFTPEITIMDGSNFSFYTRTVDGSGFPDRLEVRFSINGSSTNVGSSATSVGDFTTLLLTINPNLVEGGYPEEWTRYDLEIGDLGSTLTGRIAFRYFVTSGGPSGANSNYIGIDTFVYDLPQAAEIGPFSLLTPEDGATLTVDSDDNTTVSITWEPAEGAQTYEWLAVAAGGDFSDPALTLASNAFGSQSTLTLPASAIYNALTDLGFEHGQQVELEWTVRATAGVSSSLADEVFALTVNMGTGTSIDNVGLPTHFELAQNYPNPFNPTTNISFTLPQSSEVTLEVFNMQGQRVATLVNSTMGAGSHTVPFNAENLSSGIYLYRMTAGAFSQTNKMMLVK
jgi:hypothetical protein